jgi:hypothetical protein
LNEDGREIRWIKEILEEERKNRKRKGRGGRKKLISGIVIFCL